MSRPLRVGLAVPSLDPATGGPPVVARHVAEALAAAGHSARLAAADAADCPPVAATVSAGTLPPVGWPVALGLRPPPAELSEWVAGCDVVHLHGVWEPLLVALGRVARRLGRPYIVTPHGMLDPWSLRQKGLKKRLALWLIHHRFLDHAAALHYLNADEQRLAAEVRLASPGRVVPNGVRLPAAPPDPGLFRAKHPALGDAPYLLFLSRLHPKKGLDVLAEAFARLSARRPTLRLVVAGPEDGAGKGFADQIDKLGLRDRVVMPGPVYDADKWSALAGAAAFCLPSRQEGFSVAILEAMGAGRPVVVTDACHFPELAEAGAGRVVPLDPRAVADAVDGVLSDPDAAARMGEAGRRLVADRYTWPAVAEQLVRLYRDCLPGPAGG